MPASIKDFNAFDLSFLKALLNLKINGNYLSEVTTEQKRDLCQRFNKEGSLKLSPDHLVRVWQSGKGIDSSVTLNTLNQLCGLLKKGYRWFLFVENILGFRPKEIPNNKPYFKLIKSQQDLIDKTIGDVFHEYRNFEAFADEVIERTTTKETLTTKQENVFSLNQKERERLHNFVNRIYIELTTRKAAIPIDENEDVIEQIYDSWYRLFCIIRDELKELPISCFMENSNAAPIVKMANEILNEILRPHLTRYQAKFRTWYETEKQNPENRNISPQELQKRYFNYEELILSLRQTNNKLIKISKEFLNLFKEKH